jgi:hypothetical protein
MELGYRSTPEYGVIGVPVTSYLVLVPSSDVLRSTHTPSTAVVKVRNEPVTPVLGVVYKFLNEEKKIRVNYTSTGRHLYCRNVYRQESHILQTTELKRPYI